MTFEDVDERQLVRCLRCREMVARSDLGVDGVCRACKTTHKQTTWKLGEHRRMEKAEIKSTQPMVKCPRCKKKHFMTQDKMTCECGYVLKKRYATYY